MSDMKFDGLGYGA